MSDGRRQTRQVLALLLLPASVAVGMLGLAGILSIGWAVVLAAFGLGVAAMMPTGGRAAALSLMLWSAVLLLSLGSLIDDGPGRAGYALAAGLVFALLSAAAIWATGRAGEAKS